MPTSPVIDRPAAASESARAGGADALDRIAETVQQAQCTPERHGGWVMRTRRTSPLDTRYTTR